MLCNCFFVQQGLRGLIRVSGVHNHATTNADALSYLPPSAELRNTFEGTVLIVVS